MKSERLKQLVMLCALYWFDYVLLLGSQTPGHPEHFLTPGVEVTTGPLGQGVGNAVGFALAERFLAARYNRGGQQVVDHRTWAFCSATGT